MLNKIIRFFLENKLVTTLVLILFVSWGIVTSPFGWDTGILPKDPVPVDAIPDIGENQQIVFTDVYKRQVNKEVDSSSLKIICSEFL